MQRREVVRVLWWRGSEMPGSGAAFKKSLVGDLGPWDMTLYGFGASIARMARNEKKMLDDMVVTATEMFEAMGATNITPIKDDTAPGLVIHEMGTARMGRDPKTSVLNAHNQVWDARNVFMTDGACMTSSANQNPSITYMALTARAADQAVKLLNRREL